MKAIIDSRPFPVCILRSGDPARAHDNCDLAETFKRNTPPIQYKAGGGDVERSAYLDLDPPGEFA